MDLKQLIKDYLKAPRVMQLATSIDNKPWVCTVHFLADDNLHFYWISTPQRRHSQEITKNPQVAVTIMIHEDTPDEKYVIGISAEGRAEMISHEEAEHIADTYIARLEKPPTLFEDMKSGKNPHKFYKLKPTNIVLFDYKNFPDNPRQEYTLNLPQ